ncbi:response regulator [Oscillospiraceae bacterium PP1C4]
MFKILIADDECFIRKGIIAILQRSMEDEITFLEAGNGIEALKICNEQAPQLVISDIRMPCCDGLEFIQKMRENANSPAIIILSGYEDFEYAKTAMKLGVKDYVLKPIKKPEFVKLIGEYVRNIIDSKQRAQEETTRSIASKKIAEKLKRSLLMELLNCSDEPEARDRLEKLSDLGVSFHKMLFLCAVVQYRIHEENEDYIDFAVKNILDDVLHMEDKFHSALTIQHSQGNIAVIFEERDQLVLLPAAKQVLRQCITLIRKHLDVQVFVGLGNVVYDSVLLCNSFHLAQEALNFKLYETGESIQPYSDIPVGQVCESVNFDTLVQPLEQIDHAEIVNKFFELSRLPMSRNAMIAIKSSYVSLEETVSKHLMRYRQVKNSEVPMLCEFNLQWSFPELRQEVAKYVKEIRAFASSSLIDVSNKKLLFDVIRYIQENATKDINLNTVAAHFSRTPSYISALFKKGANEGFSEYLTNERVKVAKNLLADSTIPIGQVGEFCGYPNPKYFSVVFKKSTGESPATFRQNSIG